MLKKTVLRRQYLSKFDTLYPKTTYKKGSKKSGGLLRASWTATQYLDCFSQEKSGQLLRRQLNCSPTDKKEKQKSHRFAFLKISFADTHLAHLLLPHFIFMEWQKQKSQILHNAQKLLFNFKPIKYENDFIF
jgi:hypothetical protein